MRRKHRCICSGCGYQILVDSGRRMPDGSMVYFVDTQDSFTCSRCVRKRILRDKHLRDEKYELIGARIGQAFAVAWLTAVVIYIICVLMI